jgi:hypothetical protein
MIWPAGMSTRSVEEAAQEERIVETQWATRRTASDDLHQAFHVLLRTPLWRHESSRTE